MTAVPTTPPQRGRQREPHRELQIKRPQTGPGFAPEAQAVLAPAARHRVIRRLPAVDRVDVMADPLPGVPGWREGPCIRAGALDFKAHQRHGRY